MEARYGSAQRALDRLEDLRAIGDEASWSLAASAPTAAFVAIRRGDPEAAARLLDGVDPNAPTEVSGQKAHVLSVRAHLSVVRGEEDANARLESALRHSKATSADLWHEYALALQAIWIGDLARYVRSTTDKGTWPLTYVAEQVVQRLGDLGEDEFQVVQREASLRPERWRSALRVVVDASETAPIQAAKLLEVVGDADDIGRLRTIAHRHRGKPEAELGRALSRRVAAPIYVEDQGRVAIRVGDRVVDGSSIRRKVLALLCFLLTKPSYAATRDEVMEALWPEFDPADALNSLNQTVYFLRRIFEPAYKDDLSPGYVHHESDVIWLVRVGLIREVAKPGAHAIIWQMSVEPTRRSRGTLAPYSGQFALDFAYEEWASRLPNITSLVDTSKSSRRRLPRTRRMDNSTRGIDSRGARWTSTPEADQIELSLLRLYRLSGSHAAAAEQYAHYAAVLRDHLGVEPPSLESL